MTSIFSLRQLLLHLLSGQPYREHDLFSQLETNESQLLNIFDVGKRNPQELKELESGRAVINGKTRALNTDFAKHVALISEHLGCSERYIAEILHSLTTQNPTGDAAAFITRTIAEYHARRRQLADCIGALLEAAELSDEADPTPLSQRITFFVTERLAQDGQFSKNLRTEIENLDSVLAKARVAKESAPSSTTPPNTSSPGSLGADILGSRYESLKYERRQLATSLFRLARLGLIQGSEAIHLTEWLSNNPVHPMTHYIVPTVLTILEPVDERRPSGQHRNALTGDRTLIAFMTRKLSANTEWQDSGLKSTILLKWALFLTDSRHQNPALEAMEGYGADQLEAQVRQAVNGGTFHYLARTVVEMRRLYRSPQVPSLLVDLTDHFSEHEKLTDEFTTLALLSFDNLLRLTITHASSELRKVKQRQEDVSLANARMDRSRLGSTMRFVSTSDVDKPKNDIAILFSFIGILYSSLPSESALQFWGSGPQVDPSRISYLEYLETTAGKLPAFLQWAVWSTQPKDTVMSTALYDMLAGLSTGQQCSELAYNFMARGGGEVVPGSSLPSSIGSSAVSWHTVFALLWSWSSNNSASLNAASQSVNLNSLSNVSQHIPPPPPITPDEVRLAQAFLRLLSNVVTHAVNVRAAIASNTTFRAIPTLISLIPLGVPLELKGSIFQTLCAFCEPGAGDVGLDICKAVWMLMERNEVISVRSQTGSLAPSAKGVEVELDGIESTAGEYPVTLPFLQLLSTLIHTPKRSSLKERISEPVGFLTIPEGLGQPYRLPGIGPFVAFVVDNVFADISTRDFRFTSDRWVMHDSCLSFVERCLASFDLEALLVAAESNQLKPDTLSYLLVHPGYDIMKRMLSETPLQSSILSYILAGVEELDRGSSDDEHFYSIFVRVLRITHRVLEVQDIFLDVLIPLLSEFDSSAIIGKVHGRSYFTRFDKILSFDSKLVPSLAVYAHFSAHPELVYLSVKILSTLASSPSLPNLAALIEGSDDSARIQSGYQRILNIESFEDVSDAEAAAEQLTGAGAPDPSDASPLDQATRIVSIDFLSRHCDVGKQYPNVAHFLLFGGMSTKQLESAASQPTCLHSILDLVNAGIPRRGKGKERVVTDVPLFESLPALAERCYLLIHRLCHHPKTSDFTMRYLRTTEDFFCRHLVAVPALIPETLQEPVIEIVHEDGTRVTSTVSAATAFLKVRAWILDMVSLDLHVLANKGQTKAVTEIVEILLGTSVFSDPSWEDELLRPFQDVGQSHMRIIEFVRSLAFDWADSLSVQTQNLELLGQLNLMSCIRKDALGCEVVDKSALLALLSDARRVLRQQNRLATPAHEERFSAEFDYILQSCAVENHRREMAFALSISYDSWRRLLDTTLTRCFDRIPQDERENMLFELLHVVPIVLSSTEVDESTAILLSEVILSCITKLREDRRHRLLLQAAVDAETTTLPAERLHTILRSVLQCIVDNNHGASLVRGNLYAALINYVHLISPANPSSPESSLSNASMASSLLSSSFRQSTPSLGESTALVLASGQPSSQSSASQNILRSTITVLKGVMDRLVETLGRDATDGTEVWKTVAFMLLDTIVKLSSREKQQSALTSFVRRGLLRTFVDGLKNSDIVLQSVLKPDPDDLNPLYVYESSLSLFIRLAQTRSGAEKLLDAQLIPILGDSDYLDARPDTDQSFMEGDTFLPSAMQIYHQLFMPALQVVSAVVATMGHRHTTAATQALDFVMKHSPTISILLKTDADDLSVGALEELHLLISICADVLHLVPKSELASANAAYGSIHTSILSLSVRCLGRERWLRQIKPVTDAEILSASVAAPGHGSRSEFELGVRRMERLLRESLVVYLGAASEYTEPEINLTLSPVVVPPRGDGQGSRYLGAIPSIGDALEALNSFSSDLAATLQQIADISSELASRDIVGMENISDIVRGMDSNLQDLNMHQKRALICNELERMKQSAVGEARIIIDTIEMLLLLIWRHVVYYVNEGESNGPQSTPHAMRFISTPNPDVFRQEVASKLAGLLQRLQEYLADATLLDEGWRPNELYAEIMCRNLREAIGIASSDIAM